MRKFSMIAIVAASFALVSCGQKIEERDRAEVTPNAETPAAIRVAIVADQYVYRFCDQGRAVYMSSDYDSTAIAVVENAAECNK